jgi:hypothetical protein
VLFVTIHEQNIPAGKGAGDGNIDGQGGFSYPTLGVSYCQNHVLS